MFQVEENNIPCDYMHHKVHNSWSNSSFEKFDDAVIYAMNWLGAYAPSNDYEWKADVPFHFQQDSWITIKEL